MNEIQDYPSTEDSGEISEGGSLDSVFFAGSGTNSTCDGTDSSYGSSVESDSADCQTGSEGYNTDSRDITSSTPTSLHWVRMSALRIHDNPALNQAIQCPGYRFKAVFIIDPWFMSSSNNLGINRARFLLECLHDLDKNLRAYNTRLYVAQGQPVAVLEQLVREWNVRQLTFQQVREPHSKAVEESVERLGDIMDVKVTKFSSHTLYNPDDLLALNKWQPIMTQKTFKQLLPLIGPPSVPVDPPDISISNVIVCDEDHNFSKYMIPTMEGLGYPPQPLFNSLWVGGETEALRRLPTYCQLRCHSATNQCDMLFDKSALSPYVRFGCLSVRFFLWKTKWLAKTTPALDCVAHELTRKLLEREFFFVVAAQVPNFDVIEKNPICLRMPWEHDPIMFHMWREGRTGYPWIDAAMRQLRKEGWIHHQMRESVAAFLTRGDLWISWEAGKDVFEEYLLDYEPTVSCACWMKSSCSAFFSAPIPHYCPVTFGQKIDPQGLYIRTYCPELKNFPTEYIFSPWLAPKSVQDQADCRIGTDYPHPMLDHATAGAICCERLKSVMKLLHQKTLSHSAPLSEAS